MWERLTLRHQSKSQETTGCDWSIPLISETQETESKVPGGVPNQSAELVKEKRENEKAREGESQSARKKPKQKNRKGKKERKKPEGRKVDAASRCHLLIMNDLHRGGLLTENSTVLGRKGGQVVFSREDDF